MEPKEPRVSGPPTRDSPAIFLRLAADRKALPRWWGVCHFCDRSGAMKQFMEEETKNRGLEFLETLARSWLPKDAGDLQPVRLIEVNRGVKKRDYRIPLFGPFGSEVARVLGGDLVPGSLVLIGGDPGVGKSTLLLQVAALIAEGHDCDQPACVVYVSGEESVEQISSRAERMKIGANELYLYAGTDIEDILMKIQPLSPRALIVDSVQTVYLKEVTGSAGGHTQVRECTSALLRFAKKTNIPVLLAGHVTNSGDIAGPRVLEHNRKQVEAWTHRRRRILRGVMRKKTVYYVEEDNLLCCMGNRTRGEGSNENRGSGGTRDSAGSYLPIKGGARKLRDDLFSHNSRQNQRAKEGKYNKFSSIQSFQEKYSAPQRKTSYCRSKYNQKKVQREEELSDLEGRSFYDSDFPTLGIGWSPPSRRAICGRKADRVFLKLASLHSYHVEAHGFCV
ncbi:DNA repair protein RadA-like protein [Hibiscus syriacus]|uniref:DNA repair protein RadA-like protein n=1 Tax=Hibiscus syriacus TaxID=106335 RepID=A0A6A3BSI4_HIBSY|nr:DNA repair protein RadA-like protein [Hibiscus syriacus]